MKAGAAGSGVGPDLAVVGAARSGTSLLAANLAAHPNIDASAVKEPNYFSRHHDRPSDWYDAYFMPRSPELMRLDASVSYTYPQFPDAMSRLVEASPSVFVVYVVRDPIPRAVSHFQYYRHYFDNEDAPNFGAALARDSYYSDVSDYERWLDVLSANVADDRILVVPFEAVKRSGHAVASQVCEQAGLAEPPNVDVEAARHQNQVVTFRSDRVRRMTRSLRRSRAYPLVRRAVGPNRVRRIRSAVTSEPRIPSLEESVATCNDGQRKELEELRLRAEGAVAQWLKQQDERLGLTWSTDWPGTPGPGRSD